jgi:hypothetical protein
MAVQISLLAPLVPERSFGSNSDIVTPNGLVRELTAEASNRVRVFNNTHPSLFIYHVPGQSRAEQSDAIRIFQYTHHTTPAQSMS